MHFQEIIAANLEELSLFLESNAPESSIEAFYASVLQFYHLGDFPALEKTRVLATQIFAQHPEYSSLRQAIDLRIALRTRTVSEALIRELKESERNRWAGELSILQATCFTILDRHEEAKKYFARAASEFEAAGIFAKALRARFNMLVAESHIDNRANLIPKYFALHRMALRKSTRDEAIATLCLLNISREYELIGSLHAALKYATQAIHVGEANFGNQAYYLCLAHRAHLLVLLGRIPEARVDYDCAKAGNFLEVKAALEFVREQLAPHFADLAAASEAHAEHLLPTWKMRKGAEDYPKLSALETKLVDFLGQGAKPKAEILEHIYGERLDYEVKLNRFKAMIGHLRRKSPHLLICENGEYRLSSLIEPPKRIVK